MSIAVQQLFAPVALTTANQLLFINGTLVAGQVVKNGRMRFSNTTGGSLNLTAYAVPYLGTAGSGNAFMTTEALAANAHVDVDIPVLGAGDFLVAKASATGITAFCMDGVIYSGVSP